MAGLEGNWTHRRPEGPSQTPRELSTPMVYNPQSTLESLLLLKEFNDFSVFAKNSHFVNINFAWYVCRFSPPLKERGAKVENVRFYLSKIDVFKVPRRSGAFS